MKFRQLSLASAASAALVLGITACGQSNTIDFVYVTSANNNPGSVYAYSADGESGALRQIPGSPFLSGGRNPVGMVASPNGHNIYIINHDDNTVVEYIVGSDGTLYAQNTYNTVFGSNPTGLAISPDGSKLYVVDAYGLDATGSAFSATTPGIGALVQFPITPGVGTLGTPVAYPTCNNPVAVTVVGAGPSPSSTNPGSFGSVFVVNDPSGQLVTLIDSVAASNRGATGSSTVTYPATGACFGGVGAQGQVSGYTVNSDGSLAPSSGSPFAAGVGPVAIASDPTNRFVYVTDFITNQIIAYSIAGGGNLQPLTSNPLTNTGQQPSAVVVDPRGQYIYVSDYTQGQVSGYQLTSTANGTGEPGAPSALAGAASGQVNPGPAAITVEPSTARYIYTANFIDNSVSGLTIDPNTGATSQVQNSPFNGPNKATAVAAVRHGDHSVEVTAQF
jgi:6-phosphogluconolactonase